MRSRFAALGIDAFLVTRPSDVSYLTDFSGEDSLLILSADRTVLATDFRYVEQARVECPWLEQKVREGKMSEAVVEVLLATGARVVGFDPNHTTVAQVTEIEKSLAEAKRSGKADPGQDLRLAAVDGGVAGGRKVKDEHELAIIRRAIRAAEEAFLAWRGMIRAGMSENELAALLLLEMRRRGASDSSFPVIVASGPAASQPHYRPRQVPVRWDAPLLVDWGARLEGYCSDLTRTLLLGKVDGKIREIYRIVLDAQRKAIAALRPGLDSQAADAVAREYIAGCGYGEQFGHSLGHGIGRDVHEGPALRKTPPGEPLLPGQIVTVEPGIYLPGVGGVRIEDDVLITETGCEVLSSLPKEWEDCSIA